MTSKLQIMASYKTLWDIAMKLSSSVALDLNPTLLRIQALMQL
jgi:hypothetical protein